MKNRLLRLAYSLATLTALAIVLEAARKWPASR